MVSMFEMKLTCSVDGADYEIIGLDFVWRCSWGELLLQKTLQCLESTEIEAKAQGINRKAGKSREAERSGQTKHRRVPRWLYAWWREASLNILIFCLTPGRRSELKVFPYFRGESPDVGTFMAANLVVDFWFRGVIAGTHHNLGEYLLLTSSTLDFGSWQCP